MKLLTHTPNHSLTHSLQDIKTCAHHIQCRVILIDFIRSGIQWRINTSIVMTVVIIIGHQMKPINKSEIQTGKTLSAHWIDVFFTVLNINNFHCFALLLYYRSFWSILYPENCIKFVYKVMITKQLGGLLLGSKFFSGNVTDQ